MASNISRYLGNNRRIFMFVVIYYPYSPVIYYSSEQSIGLTTNHFGYDSYPFLIETIPADERVDLNSKESTDGDISIELINESLYWQEMINNHLLIGLPLIQYVGVDGMNQSDFQKTFTGFITSVDLIAEKITINAQ